MSYAVNEDGITVFDVETGTAIAVCGPNSGPVAFPAEVMQRAHAALIAKLLNEATAKP